MKSNAELRRSIETMVKYGMDVTYGQLSLCNLAHFNITRNYLDRKYQVDCNSAEVRFSNIYANLAYAIDKYIILYHVLKSKEAKLALQEEFKLNEEL